MSKPLVYISDWLPPECGFCGVILHSDHWGVAHDEGTFVEPYARYVAGSSNPWPGASSVNAIR